MEIENKCLNVPNKKLYYLINNVEYLFVPIEESNKDDFLWDTQYQVYNNLPNLVYGKIFDNVIGYNIDGWWRYIYVKKKELIYR